MKWIFTKENGSNSFAEFLLPFSYNGGRVTLKIGADYRYAAYLNGVLLPGGQHADIPAYKSINTLDISAFVTYGENTLFVVAWHMGADHSVCRTMTPAVAFEVIADDVVIAASDRHTRARTSTQYLAGDQVTKQVGDMFRCDFTAAANPWGDAVEVETDFREVARPISNTCTDAVCTSAVVTQGIFRYHGGTNAAERMQQAFMAPVSVYDISNGKRMFSEAEPLRLQYTKTDADGIYLIADMGRETCGHLSFTISVDCPCKMLLGWGEHLTDMRVRTNIRGRNFATEFLLHAGENVFDDGLFRFGCRYISVFLETEQVTVTRLGIREVRYPFSFIPKDFGDGLLNAIYEVGRRTLSLSAHDHYEDCPWREQALYGMDSRNQMLFGYGAFGEYDFPRANLLTLARCLREDGLVEMTPPARQYITIPVFTAYWLIAIAENVEADYNEDFLREILPSAARGLDALLSRESACGMDIFCEPQYWNFHEWSDGLDGFIIEREHQLETRGDAILTALTAVASEKISALFAKLGDFRAAAERQATAERLRMALEQYYDPERCLYASYRKDGIREGYHEYTQAVMLFANAVPRERVPQLCAALQEPEAHQLTPATFAALQPKYAALIKEGYGAWCKEEMVRLFAPILFKGATAYPETALCEADFHDAGSLCHGWSAVCCWVLDTLYFQK